MYRYKKIVNALKQNRKREERHTLFRFKLSNIIATWFYLGAIPVMPGTIASCSVYPIYYLVMSNVTTPHAFMVSMHCINAVLCCLGLWAIRDVHKSLDIGDHKAFVIDEVVGQMLVLGLSSEMIIKIVQKVSIHKNDPNIVFQSFCIGMILFRFFDIKKPFFIKFVDRHMHGAFGIMLDDILAALFASGTIFIVWKVLSFF